jgi:quercetin dioxygenase-like cupin family protein
MIVFSKQVILFLIVLIHAVAPGLISKLRFIDTEGNYFCLDFPPLPPSLKPSSILEQIKGPIVNAVQSAICNTNAPLTTNPPVFVGPNEGTNLAVLTYGNSSRTIKLRANQTGGRLTLMEGVLLPGEGPPIHIHSREDESFHVLEGELQFQIGDTYITAKPGEWIYAPVGIKHTFRNVNSTNARLEFVFTPGGIEHYFEEVSQVFIDKPANWSDIANQIALKYGIQMLGTPDWNG